MRAHFLILVLLIAFGSCACRPSPTTRPEPPSPPTDVRWTTLIRDHTTAKRYSGVTVRIVLEPREYEFSGGEIRVWASARTMPPVLIFHLFPGHPPVSGPVTVVGVCSAPVRDGIVRDRGIDYFIVVENCVVTPRASSAP